MSERKQYVPVEKEQPKRASLLPELAAKITMGLEKLVEMTKNTQLESVWDRTFNQFFLKALKIVHSRSQRALQEHNPGEIEIATNKNYRPINEIFLEAINNYQEKPDFSHLSFVESSDKFSFREFIAFFNQGYSTEDLQVIKEKNFPLFHKIERKKLDIIGKSTSQVVVEFLQNKFTYEEIREIVRMKLPNHVSSLMRQAEEDNLSSLDSKTGDQQHLEYYYQAKNFIEDKVKQTQKPVSASVIMQHFLEVTKGNVDKTLQLTAGFLKFMSREAIDNPVISDQHWIQNHVTDEYSLDVPYSELGPIEEPLETSKSAKLMGLIKEKFLGISYSPKPINYDYSLLNKSGLPYHAWHMLALLKDFSPEMIAIMTNIEYVLHGSGHGWSKYAADLAVITQLKDFQNSLLNYSQKKKAHQPINYGPLTAQPSPAL